MNDRKVLLRCGEQEIGGVANGVAVGQRMVFGQHRRANRDAGGQQASHRGSALLRRAEIDEKRDEDQQEMGVKQSIQSHADGQHAPGPGCDAGGFVFRLESREDRAKHAAAIHRKSGNNVECSENEVGFGDALDDVSVAGIDEGDDAADGLMIGCRSMRRAQC